MVIGRWYFCGSLLAACVVAALADPARAAQATGAAADVTVSGFSRGYSHAALESLIRQGVAQAVAGQRDGEPAPLCGAAWSFSVQPNGGNRPLTLVAAHLTDGRAQTISGYFTSAALGTSPADVFVGQVRLLANSLIAQEGTAR